MISIVQRGKLFLHKYGYWVFAVGVGLIVVFLEEFEPFFSIAFFLYIITLILWGAIQIIRQTKTVIHLKNEQAKTELMHLQSQVSPHFFFNTLNNLYGLIDKNAPQAKEMILTLSEMMRYSIYEGQKESVILEDEIRFLQNYINLHQARYHKKTDIRFKLDVGEGEFRITPLLFIILLENAFKHGVENLRKGAYIHVDLMANENEITFVIENNFDSTIVPDEAPGVAGIGLKNLKRRLELVYPKRHTFFHLASNNTYKTQLTLR